MRISDWSSDVCSFDLEEYEEWDGLSDTGSPGQDALIPIPNPPIPGPAAVSIEALQSHVNEFAKENEFGIIKRNGSGSRRPEERREGKECGRKCKSRGATNK